MRPIASSETIQPTVTYDLSNILTTHLKPRLKPSDPIQIEKRMTDLRRPQRSFKFVSATNFREAWDKQRSEPAVFVFTNADGTQAVASPAYPLLNFDKPFEQDD